MPESVSAIEAISPAFEQMKRQLFQPFRFGLWARLAVVSLATGEFATGSWSGMGSGDFSRTGGGSDELLGLADPVWQQVQQFLPWLLLGVVALIGLVLVFVYIESVFRFVLLDAVLTDRCELRAGWRRWQSPGSSYFLWQLALTLIFLVALAVLVGLPIFLAWRAGLFRQPNENFGVLVLGGFGLFFVLLGLILLGALVGLFAKDFLVPLMALENLSVMDAWRRLLPMLWAEKLPFAGYVLMKIVLAVGTAIVLGIVNLIVLLALLIPLAIVGVIIVLAAQAAGLTWDLWTVLGAVGLGTVGIGIVFYVIAFVAGPAVVFFQAYTLQFFGPRYPVLAAQLARLGLARLRPMPPAAPPTAGGAAS